MRTIVTLFASQVPQVDDVKAYRIRQKVKTAKKLVEGGLAFKLR